MDKEANMAQDCSRKAVELSQVVIKDAGQADLPAILQLQKAAFLSQAEIYSDHTLPPLLETLEELQSLAAGNVHFLAAWYKGRVIGSVRAYQENGVCHIGRLVVDPACQNCGLGRKLMLAIEKQFPGARFELFTGHRSTGTLALYRKLGYTQFREVKVNDDLSLVYLCKQS